MPKQAVQSIPDRVTSASAGEFGELLMPGASGYILAGEAAVSASPDDVVVLLRRVMSRPDLPIAAREYALTSLMKLSARLPGIAPSVQVSQHVHSKHLDAGICLTLSSGWALLLFR